MRKPNGIIEIFLQPGELYFGDRYTRIRPCWAPAYRW